jgi:REP element-mobilizing transposase RayT
MLVGMGSPIVVAHHLMWTCYGWWLPNDPRGSTSERVYTARLAQLAPLRYGRKAVQPAWRDIRAFYAQASKLLQYPLLEFRGCDFAPVAQALEESLRAHRYTCYACAIMPDHVHLILRKHRHSAEQMIENLQTESRSRLSCSGLRDANHPTWTKGGWKVFLDHPTDVRRTIKYIDNNPIKRRLPGQRWSFVTRYDDWPLHEGHSRDSPYARALKACGRYTSADLARARRS